MKLVSLFLATTIVCASNATAANYSANGNTGFGGVVSSLDITDNGTDITFTLTRGVGTLNDSLVIYIDSIAGGSNSTTNYNDVADPLRRALSGRGTGAEVSVITFPTGFTADYGIALDSGFSGVWSLVNSGSHAFVATANGAPGGNAQATYAMTTTLANLGLGPGSTLNFVATYLNSGNAFRSNEGVGDGLPGTNVGQNPATFTGARAYTVVPEPSSALFLSLSILGLTALSRRR